MSKDKGLNLDDFKLENVLDDTYTSPEAVDNSTPEVPEVVAETPVVKDTPAKPVVEEKPPVVEEDEDEYEDTPEEVPAPEGNEMDLTPFYNLFHEKLGWEVTGEDMPENSVEGLIGYMNEIVENASKPQYANEVSEKFDKFLAAGGDPQKFISTMFASKDYTTFEIKTDEDKKQVLKDYLSKTNPDRDSAWVERKIDRYEDSGVLDEESEDALDILRKNDKIEKESLLAKQVEAQKKEAEAYQNQIQKLETTLKSKTEVAGIPVNQKEMVEFFNFLTKPEKDGKTKYEKALSSNEEASTILAYVAFKGFNVNNLKASVKSDVVKDLKQSLSKFSNSTTGLNSKTSIPVSSNNTIDYNKFNLNL